ncbi:MAG TPA: hypothetical protein VIP81_06895, partial [Chitinophaga sp.]
VNDKHRDADIGIMMETTIPACILKLPAQSLKVYKKYNLSIKNGFYPKLMIISLTFLNIKATLINLLLPNVQLLSSLLTK